MNFLYFLKEKKSQVILGSFDINKVLLMDKQLVKSFLNNVCYFSWEISVIIWYDIGIHEVKSINYIQQLLF